MVKLPAAPLLDAIDFAVWQDTRKIARVAAKVVIRPIPLTDGEVSDLVAFLEALTGGKVGKAVWAGRKARPLDWEGPPTRQLPSRVLALKRM